VYLSNYQRVSCWGVKQGTVTERHAYAHSGGVQILALDGTPICHLPWLSKLLFL
jgi:hypothetical protein